MPTDSSSSSSSTGSGDTATSVAISAATDGTCTAGFGGGAPGGGGAGGGTPPTDFPTDGALPTDGARPTGMPSAPDGSGEGPGAFGGFVSGLVTAVSGTTITVDAADMSGTTSPTDVTVGEGTAYTVTRAADASALVVGQCVTAQGESDSSGAVAATSLLVSEPTDGSCTMGFGAGRPGGPGGGSAPSTS
ncbi:hypothetical protein GCM10010988_29330 [Cnuibacter physcomitrellae]|nr:hypothetical protein GCM10010988_29330 [Cnuibacter physcomitrellae]